MAQKAAGARPVSFERPEVRHDNGEPDDSWLIEDTLQRLRRVHEIPLRGLSAIEAETVPETRSVWDALGKTESGPGRRVGPKR